MSGLLAAGLGEAVTIDDMTDCDADLRTVVLEEDDVALIAVPSYSGRVPAVAAGRIMQIRGNGARAVLVCVYGNRAYEDTLAELADVAEKAGFRVVAAVAAIAEHSIARRYAAGRPDADDTRVLKEFAAKIKEKLESGGTSMPAIPGNRPYRKYSRVGMVPKATGACTQCGICADMCPVGAIDMDNPTKVDKKACISCMRCVAVCRHKARKVNVLLMAIANRMLKKVCSVRKECEMYV